VFVHLSVNSYPEYSEEWKTLSYVNPEQMPPLVSWQQNPFRGIIFTGSHEQELNKVD